MKPLDNSRDDLLPEENDKRQEALVTFLRQAYPAHPDLSQEKQKQILTRVRERLRQTEQTLSTNEEAPLHLAGSTDSLPFKHRSVSPQSRRGAGFRRTITTLAAVLVVGVLISGSLLLLPRLLPQQHSRPVSPIPRVPKKTVTVISSVGGLEMSLSLTAGPYFLSEMLAVDISLTNHTQNTYEVGVPFVETLCGYGPGVWVTGGKKPEYDIPVGVVYRCPSDAGGQASLQPGSTLTTHNYLPLKKSGEQTLTGSVGFSNQGATPPVPSSSEGHWPTIQISVSPMIPSDRKLSLEIKNAQVIVHAPAETPANLAYFYGVWCYDTNNDGGGPETGSAGWEPISTNRVNEPECHGKNVHWDFAFGAPGYGVAWGSYPSSS